MERQCFFRVLLAACAAVVLWAGAAQALPVLIAGTSFETSDNYVAATDIKGQPAAAAPMPDGLGWGSNNWAGEGTSATRTPVVNDVTKARSGSQYFVIHTDTSPNTDYTRLRRKYDTSLIQDNQVAFAASIRLDTDAAEYAAKGKYFEQNFNLYLEQSTSSGNPSEGKQNLRIEFTRDGTYDVNVKTAGSSFLLGHWTDPNGGVCAKDTWLDVVLVANISTSMYEVYMNGVDKGSFAFYAPLGTGEVLNQIRFMGPKNYSGYMNGGGVSIDDVSLSTTPEPATIAFAALGGLLVLRRRTQR
jgi:hypothetical protein